MINRETDRIDYIKALTLGVFETGDRENGLGLPVGGLEGRGGEGPLAVDFVVKGRVLEEFAAQARASHWSRIRKCEDAGSRRGKRRACWAHRRISMA